MGESQGFVGLGTLLKIGNGQSPEQFNSVLEVKDINGPNRSMEFAEFTHQQSTGFYREYKPTFKTSGDITFKCNFVPGDSTQDGVAAGLTYDYENRILRNFQLVFPSSPAKTFSFHAYVSQLGVTAPMANPTELNVTLRVTGPVTEL